MEVIKEEEEEHEEVTPTAELEACLQELAEAELQELNTTMALSRTERDEQAVKRALESHMAWKALLTELREHKGFRDHIFLDATVMLGLTVNRVVRRLRQAVPRLDASMFPDM